MSQRPSIFPYRLQYRTPAGDVKVTDPIYGIHEAQVVGWQLVAAGNVIEYAYRDAGPHTGNYSQYPMPCQAVRLGH